MDIEFMQGCCFSSSNLSAVALVVGLADSLCVDFQAIHGFQQRYGARAVVGEACVVEGAEDVFSGRHTRHAVQLHRHRVVRLCLRCDTGLGLGLELKVTHMHGVVHFCLRCDTGLGVRVRT